MDIFQYMEGLVLNIVDIPIENQDMERNQEKKDKPRYGIFWDM